MRVIGGDAGGMRLSRPPGGTRPVSDRAREGLFSHLGGLVSGAVCLDLYAGTGALGIEALSRGAERCVFVDSSPAAIRTIRENLARTGFEARAELIRSDATRYLARPPGGERFALAFADPPYSIAERGLRQILEALTARLVPNATFVLTRPSKSSIDVIPVNWQAVRRLAYGDSLVLVCREERERPPGAGPDSVYREER